MTNYNTLKLVEKDGFLFLELNRPEVKNAFNGEMIEELTEVFQGRALNPEIRAIVLSGSGNVFCAGGDLNWMRSSVDLSLEENLKDTSRLTFLFKLMNEVPKPLIGLVKGAVIGGGVGLVSVCDYVVATENTTFGLSEVRLGLIPACIGPFVVSKIGASHARGLFMMGERFQTKRAYEVGLIHEVVASESDLEKSSQRILGNIAECAPSAMAHAKNLVLSLSWPEKRAEIKNCYHMVSEMLAELRVSEEGQEGVKAFLEKRKPNWIKK